MSEMDRAHVDSDPCSDARCSNVDSFCSSENRMCPYELLVGVCRQMDRGAPEILNDLGFVGSVVMSLGCIETVVTKDRNKALNEKYVRACLQIVHKCVNLSASALENVVKMLLCHPDAVSLLIKIAFNTGNVRTAMRSMYCLCRCASGLPSNQFVICLRRLLRRDTGISEINARDKEGLNNDQPEDEQVSLAIGRWIDHLCDRCFENRQYSMQSFLYLEFLLTEIFGDDQEICVSIFGKITVLLPNLEESIKRLIFSEIGFEVDELGFYVFVGEKVFHCVLLVLRNGFSIAEPSFVAMCGLVFEWILLVGSVIPLARDISCSCILSILLRASVLMHSRNKNSEYLGNIYKDGRYTRMERSIRFHFSNTVVNQMLQHCHRATPDQEGSKLNERAMDLRLDKNGGHAPGCSQAPANDPDARKYSAEKLDWLVESFRLIRRLLRYRLKVFHTIDEKFIVNTGIDSLYKGELVSFYCIHGHDFFTRVVLWTLRTIHRHNMSLYKVLWEKDCLTWLFGLYSKIPSGKMPLMKEIIYLIFPCFLFHGSVDWIIGNSESFFARSFRIMSIFKCGKKPPYHCDGFEDYFESEKAESVVISITSLLCQGKKKHEFCNFISSIDAGVIFGILSVYIEDSLYHDYKKRNEVNIPNDVYYGLYQSFSKSGRNVDHGNSKYTLTLMEPFLRRASGISFFSPGEFRSYVRFWKLFVQESGKAENGQFDIRSISSLVNDTRPYLALQLGALYEMGNIGCSLSLLSEEYEGGQMAAVGPLENQNFHVYSAGSPSKFCKVNISKLCFLSSVFGEWANLNTKISRPEDGENTRANSAYFTEVYVSGLDKGGLSIWNIIVDTYFSSSDFDGIMEGLNAVNTSSLGGLLLSCISFSHMIEMKHPFCRLLWKILLRWIDERAIDRDFRSITGLIAEFKQYQYLLDVCYDECRQIFLRIVMLDYRLNKLRALGNGLEDLPGGLANLGLKTPCLLETSFTNSGGILGLEHILRILRLHGTLLANTEDRPEGLEGTFGDHLSSLMQIRCNGPTKHRKYAVAPALVAAATIPIEASVHFTARVSTMCNQRAQQFSDRDS